MCTLCTLTGNFDPARHPSGSQVNATIIETRDAAANMSTVYSMQVGDVFTGTLDPTGDRDWVAISLEAGSTYDISLQGNSGGGGTLGDPYLRIYDANGNQVGFNDDGGPGLDSLLSFTAAATATYYIQAASHNDTGSGTYRISVEEDLPHPEASLDELANYLTHGYWADSGREARSFDTSASNQITVDISGLTAEGQQLARWAMEAWEMVANIEFVEINGSAMITMDDENSGAYAGATTVGRDILNSQINVGRDWLSAYGTTIGSYSFQTYIHEIGHALGLGHQGNYNGTARYGVDETFTNDSWQISVMSYFDQTQNTSINASYGLLVTTMIADVIAIQNLYGAPGESSITAGNTVWGVNSNLSGYLGDYFDLLSGGRGNGNFAGGELIAMTIYDVGGRDLLNLVTSTTDDRIDLREESFSDVGGRIGALGIARGTVIEDVSAGSGNDEITGNDVRNHIRGNGGNDTIYGGGGNDLLEGGIGNDRLFGDSGADVIRGGIGNDRIIGGTGNDRLFGEGGADVIRGGSGNDRIIGGSDNDRLLGDGGADLIRGGTGSDTINGGGGDDMLFGDGGADVFIFGNRHGHDVIRDFEFGRADELIDLRAITSITNMAQLNASAEDTADGVLITTGAGSSILLAGLIESQLSANDFMFV